MGVSISKMLFSVGAGGAATLLIYTLWKNESEVQAAPRSPLMGLQNCGNSCFLNALLQAYASCRFLLGWLRIKDVECNNDHLPVTTIQSYRGISYPLIAAMHRAILVINRDLDVDDSIYSSKIPVDVLTALRCHGHRVGVQQEQDAFELFQLVSMILNNEVEQSIRRKQIGSMDVLEDNSETEEEEQLVLQVNHPVHGVDMGCGDWSVVGNMNYRVSERIYSKRKFPMKLDYKSLPKSPFHIMMFAQMQCLVCMTKTKVRLEASESLTLPLPQGGATAGISINDLLSTYMKPGLVHNVDCDTCTSKALENIGVTGRLSGAHSKVKSTFFKYNYIAKLPSILCIHIPRSLWGEEGLTKRGEYIRFQERLNLSVLKRLYDANGNEDENHEDEAEAVPVKSDKDGAFLRFRNSEYHLVAVISHVGSGVDGGHFVTFRKQVSQTGNSAASLTWYYISDEIVHPIPYSCVMGTNAYMLFYEKTHTSA